MKEIAPDALLATATETLPLVFVGLGVVGNNCETLLPPGLVRSAVLNVTSVDGIGTAFWLSVASSDTNGSPVDVIYIELIDGATTNTLGSFSNLNKGGGYVWRSFDVTRWAGKNVTLRFRATTNNKLSTSFSVDDVSVQ